MSSEVECEVCKAKGRRRTGKASPEGWLFGEATYEDRTCKDDTIVVLVCSEECSKAFWRKGPGKLDLLTGVMTPAVEVPRGKAP